MVISVSDFLIVYGIYLLIFLLFMLAGFIWSLRDPERRLRWHSVLLKVPKLNHWLKLAVFSDWCRSMALLLSSQVPAVHAMKIANAGVSNLALRETLNKATRRVQEGETIHSALSEQSHIPGFMLHLIGSGEASSNLESMLQRIADYYAAMIRSEVDTLLKLLNPLLLIVIAGIIMVIILGVLTPIMQMNQMV